MTRSCLCRITFVIAVLVGFVVAELPPVKITCISKNLIDEEAPFYEESSYEDIETIVFNDTGKVFESVLIPPFFASALFLVENVGTETLSFEYTSSVSNSTENVDIPEYTFEPLNGESDIPADGSVTFKLSFTQEYEGEDKFSGIFIAFMIFKGSSTYDPISFRVQTEVAIHGCSDECSDEGLGKGECINKIGYCKCEPPWTGVTCQSSFKISNRVLCPGEPISASYAFVSASCKGYWSIYDIDGSSTTYSSGNLYPDDCVKDQFIGETNLTIFAYLKPGQYRFVYFRDYGVSEDGEIVVKVKDWKSVMEEPSTSVPKPIKMPAVALVKSLSK